MSSFKSNEQDHDFSGLKHIAFKKMSDGKQFQVELLATLRTRLNPDYIRLPMMADD